MSESLLLDQTLHGYDRGHRLLAGSFRVDAEDDRAMLAMSDLSGSRVADGFLEYLTGYMLPSGTCFVLAKTWYAAEMKRPGCVWTHSLILSKNVLEELRNAMALLPLFVRPSLDLDFRYSDKLSIPLMAFRNDALGPSKPEMSDALSVLSELYAVDNGSVGMAAASGTEMEPFLLSLWSQMWSDLRAKVSFCTGSLSLRVLNGRPLDLQCGPGRILRELDTASAPPYGEKSWTEVIAGDLFRPGAFRDFLHENGAGLDTRRSMTVLAKVYTSLAEEMYFEALRAVADAFPLQEEALELKRTVLRRAANAAATLQVADTLPLLAAAAFASFTSDIENVLKAFAQKRPRDLALAFVSRREVVQTGFAAFLIDAITPSLSQSDFEWMSEETPEFFNLLLRERPAIAYQANFWNWSLSIFEKVEIFRLLLRHPGTDKELLFEQLFESADSELLSRLVSDLSTEQIPHVLQWIQGHEFAATSLEWTSFLRSHQREFIEWLDNLENPNIQTVILAANVLDLSQPLKAVLTAASIERLARAVSKAPDDRQEVAAFLFVTTAWAPQPVLAPIFVDSFVSLHKAIAQSRLSIRAWQLLESILVPLPEDQWDSCEKLRRAALHFIMLNGWDFRMLGLRLAEDIDLFYDFTRTAKSFDEGKDFMALVYDASQRGDILLGKKQSKELRKLLGKSS